MPVSASSQKKLTTPPLPPSLSSSSSSSSSPSRIRLSRHLLLHPRHGRRWGSSGWSWSSLLLWPVLSCTLSSLLALSWLHFFFLYPLHEEAIDMHQRQLDPTEIVVIPYDLNRLFLFVSCTTFASWLSSSSSSSSSSIQRSHGRGDERGEELKQQPWPWTYLALVIIPSTLVMVAVMILCGASPTENLGHTFCAALYLVTMATTYPPHLGGENDDDDALGSHDLTMKLLLRRLSATSVLSPLTTLSSSRTLSSSPSSESASSPPSLSILAQCIFALNIPFSILRLYDRGWQWQRWPVPVIVATTAGWVLGNILGTIYSILLMVMVKRVVDAEEDEKDYQQKAATSSGGYDSTSCSIQKQQEGQTDLFRREDDNLSKTRRRRKE